MVRNLELGDWQGNSIIYGVVTKDGVSLARVIYGSFVICKKQLQDKKDILLQCVFFRLSVSLRVVLIYLHCLSDTVNLSTLDRLYQN